jgi:hypothetical protein
MVRMRNAWELAKVSWSVLRSDKNLAWFPVLSAIATLFALAVFGGLIAATGVNSGANNDALKPIGYVFVGLLYISAAVVATYFQAALTAGANERLNGRATSVGGALQAANAKLHRLLPWALVQATVSVVIRQLEERLGIFGQIIGSLLGAAWAVVTFLTIPIIMLEDIGPIDALKRSGTLLKQTWGENLGAQFGFGFFGLLAMIPGALLVAVGVSAGGAAIVLAVAGGVWIALVSVVMSAMTGIYKTALYRYAVDGTVPPAFAGAHLESAFEARRRRGGGFLN